MDFRLRHRAALAAALLVLCACSSTDDFATSSFVGRWRYYDGEASCQELGASHALKEIDVEIATVSRNWIEFRAGPRCHLTLEASGQRATLKTEQACEMSLRATTAFATVSTFTLEVLSDDEVSSIAQGSASLSGKELTFFCQRFAFENGKLLSRGPIPN